MFKESVQRTSIRSISTENVQKIMFTNRVAVLISLTIQLQNTIFEFEFNLCFRNGRTKRCADFGYIFLLKQFIVVFSYQKATMWRTMLRPTRNFRGDNILIFVYDYDVILRVPSKFSSCWASHPVSIHYFFVTPLRKGTFSN